MTNYSRFEYNDFYENIPTLSPLFSCSFSLFFLNPSNSCRQKVSIDITIRFNTIYTLILLGLQSHLFLFSKTPKINDLFIFLPYT
jgi:hypothetical protein